MSVRVVYRVRCAVTGQWKLVNVHGGVDCGPMEFGNADAARDAAKYVKRWKVVKVTIRSGRDRSPDR